MQVYILYFVQPTDKENWSGKFLGVYSSQKTAAFAVERLQRLPEYKHYPKGFKVDCVEVDQDYDGSEISGRVPPPGLFPPPW